MSKPRATNQNYRKPAGKGVAVEILDKGGKVILRERYPGIRKVTPRALRIITADTRADFPMASRFSVAGKTYPLNKAMAARLNQNPKTMPRKTVTAEYNAIGYTVLLNDQPIYRAGNNRQISDASASVNPNNPAALSLAEIKSFAIDTGKDLAKENGARWEGAYLDDEPELSENPRLIKYAHLTPAQQADVKRRFVHWQHDTTSPTFEAWANKHAFHVTKSGEIASRPRYAEPDFLAENKTNPAGERVADPTADEMRTFIRRTYDRLYEFDRVSEDNPDGLDANVEAAIYWFAYHYHGGQWSNLYSALSTSPYRPRPLTRGPEPDSAEMDFFTALQEHYAPGNPTDFNEP